MELSSRKNHDYAADDDAFKNFRACEMLGFPLEAGIVIRMSDKLVRVSNLLEKNAQVSDEKVTDTLRDIANYAMILKVYLDNKFSTDNPL